MTDSVEIGPAMILLGNAADSLATLPADSVDVIMTSPPFYRLRSYLDADDPAKCDEIGSEDTPEEFLERLMLVFDACWRVLKPSGVCWVEFGDSYSVSGMGGNPAESEHKKQATNAGSLIKGHKVPGYGDGSQLMNIPHRFAEAMRSRGWRWRSTCIWVHRSAMPESLGGWRWERCRVKVGASVQKPRGHLEANGKGIMQFNTAYVGSAWQDCPGCDRCRDNGGYVLRKGQWRCTTGHSYVFMFAKTDEYFCDSTAAAEPAASATINRNQYSRILDDPDEQYAVSHDHEFTGSTRNPRTVWNDITNEPQDMDACLACGRVWKGAEKKRELRKRGKQYVCTCGASKWSSHYASFPSALVRKCITPAISKGGCCEKCGVPWSPVVEKEKVGTWHDHGKNTEQGARQESGGPSANYDSGRVLAYRPSCSCSAPAAPQTVLDPFMGTATTLAVAVEMGLLAIGCELNKGYVGLAERRLREVLVPRGQAIALDAAGPLFGGAQ